MILINWDRGIYGVYKSGILIPFLDEDQEVIRSVIRDGFPYLQSATSKTFQIDGEMEIGTWHRFLDGPDNAWHPGKHESSKSLVYEEKLFYKYYRKPK